VQSFSGKIKKNIFVPKTRKIMQHPLILLLLFGSLTVQATIRTGAERLDVLLPLLEGRKTALVVNHSSVLGERRVHLLDTLLSVGVDVVRVFVPEHGFRGDADAGETVKDAKDARTGIPLISLYGKNKKPSARQLSGIDVVVFDIQDVGARFYTYISTLHYVMEACAGSGCRLVVCDRPNPNDCVDGPVLQPSSQSFVGMHPIPVLHGLTVGELASMINGEAWLRDGDGRALTCRLTVVRMLGWKHGDACRLPVKPSPNLPNDRSIRLYPSLCLFEATGISVGRGTTMPFQVLGAPDKKYGTFTFKPQSLRAWDKAPLHQDSLCYGVDLRTESEPPAGFTLKYFLDFYRLSGEGADFFTHPARFDLLAGNNLLRKQILQGMDENAIRKTWQKDLSDYRRMRAGYLFY
jgi:uncharacterized protein YbbC (DUF1343 family)